MVDVVLIALCGWCAALLMRQRPLAVLRLVAAVVTSAYASLRLSGWFTVHFLPPASPVMRWLETRVTLARIYNDGLQIPAMTPGSLTESVEWWAYHTVQVLFGCAAVLAVFCVFLAVTSLAAALYDGAPEAETVVYGPTLPTFCRHGLHILLVITASLFISAVAGTVLVEISGIVPPWLGTQLDHSILLGLLAHWIPVWTQG